MSASDGRGRDGARVPDRAPVGIVGGGITGLALAHYLDERGVDYALFEAARDPGGVIRSDRVEGCVLERGPQRVRRTDRVGDLISTLDLDPEVRTADPDLPVCVYAGGDLHPAPLSPSAFGTTDLLSAEAKRTVLAEPFTDPADPDETAAELFERKFGRETYRDLLGPLFGGIYGSDPAVMPVRHALGHVPALETRHGSLLTAALKRTAGGRDPPPAISFDDGLQRLPEALAAAHADAVYLGTPVTAVREASADGNGSAYALETPTGTTAVEEAVLTTPADLTADLLVDLAPASADALRELEYNPLALAYLRADLEADADDGIDPGALGYQVGFGEDLRTLGASWNAATFDRAVYTVFLGGMHDPEILEESDRRMGEIAAREFETVTGAPAEVVDIHQLRRGFPAYDASWDALDRASPPDGVRLATNYTARMGVPSRIREAASLADDLAGKLGVTAGGS